MHEEVTAPGLTVGIWLYRGVGDSLRSVRRYMPKSVPNRSIVCNRLDTETEGTGGGAGSLPATVVWRDQGTGLKSDLLVRHP
jgi:hypothetical protein